MSTTTDTQRITAMRAGGAVLHSVKQALQQKATPGTSFEALEQEAQRLIKTGGATPSFSTVPGYSWATCIMKNNELCHGIPRGKTVLDGDVITIDVGLIFNGYHLDTTVSFAVGTVSGTTKEFLSIGQRALSQAIAVVEPGVSVYTISATMEKILSKARFGAVYQLTGHGIGKELHMEPSIPVAAQKRDKRIHLEAGQTVAIEVMYTAGSPDLVMAKDNWTYVTADGSLSGMFEETVLVTERGYEILT